MNGPPAAAAAAASATHESSSIKTKMSTSSKRAIHNIVKTMILVSVAFFICFSPNQWLFFFYRFGLFDWHIFYHPIYNTSLIAMYLNCCINPAIYVASYRQFQTAVRRLFCPKAISTVDGEKVEGAVGTFGMSTVASRLPHRAAGENRSDGSGR